MGRKQIKMIKTIENNSASKYNDHKRFTNLSSKHIQKKRL